MTSTEAPATLPVDFDRIRPLANVAVLREIATVAFQARARLPLARFRGNELELVLRYRAVDAHAADDLLMVRADYELEAGLGGGEAPLCEVSGSFHLIYDLDEGVRTQAGADAVRIFSAINGIYHAWPYIREAVQAHLGRLALPGVVLPVWRPPSSLPSDGGFLELKRRARPAGADTSRTAEE